MRILIVNPGSTSTKIAVYDDEQEVFAQNITHPAEEIARFPRIVDQKGFRKDIILAVLREKNIDPGSIKAVVGRGGLLKPIPSGTYRVNDKMTKDLYEGLQGEHASNLGGLIADEIARSLGISAYIVDPVVVDELDEKARITGIPEIRRRSIFHALNHKYSARLAARELGKKYDEVNLIVVHLGGGISIAAHAHGRVVDVNNALNGEGPIAPERAGTIPAWDLIELVLSGKYTREELKKMLAGKGGIVAYLKTNDMREVERMVNAGDEKASLLYRTMVWRIAKEIGAHAAGLAGKVDGIVLTGGLAKWREFVDKIKESVSFISRVFVFPGENEMVALASGVLRVLRGEDKALEYG